MRVACLAPIAALLLLAACNDGQRIERPLTDVHASLVSMPAGADVMSSATVFPGTAYYLQPDGGRLIWHFTLNGKDYARFVATLREDGPSATSVSTQLEPVDDADAKNLEFLRDIARIAGEASVAAALSGRPADREAIENRIVEQVARDPLSAQTAVIETVHSEMDRYTKEYARDDNAPAHVKPGVLPKVGGQDGPRDDDNGPGTESWRN